MYRFNIKGFPTLILIEHGKYYQYNLGRSVADFSRFLKSRTVEAIDIPKPISFIKKIKMQTA